MIQQTRTFDMGDFLRVDEMPKITFKSATLQAAGIELFTTQPMVHSLEHMLDNSTAEELVQQMIDNLGSPSGHGPTSRIADSDEEEVEVDDDDEDVLVSSLAAARVDLRTPDGSAELPLMVGFTPDRSEDLRLLPPLPID